MRLLQSSFLLSTCFFGVHPLLLGLWALPASAQSVSHSSAPLTRPIEPHGQGVVPQGVLPGVEVLLEGNLDWLRNKRIGLVTHAAAVTSRLEAGVDALFRHPEIRLQVLMGPEHGIRGAAWAGEAISDQRDPKTQLPVYSLYGKTAKPTPEMLKNVDMLLYDIQDIGSRSYTYVTTLALVMEAAAEAGIPLVVLDRPNPLGGLRVEGNIPPPTWERHLVCWLRIPYVYGMTPGELAQMINGERWLPKGRRSELKVIPLKNWKRSMTFPDTHLPWVPTSPHIPHAQTSYFYAATGILGELQVLNEGVGYPLPFELIGAPWVDGEKLAQKLNTLNLPGIFFRPLSYKPFYGSYKGSLCHGVQIHLLDASKAPWVSVQFYALEALREIHPEHAVFEEAAEARQQAFDRVMGTSSIREELKMGRSVQEIFQDWQRELVRFMQVRQKYLIYP